MLQGQRGASGSGPAPPLAPASTYSCPRPTRCCRRHCCRVLCLRVQPRSLFTDPFFGAFGDSFAQLDRMVAGMFSGDPWAPPQGGPVRQVSDIEHGQGLVRPSVR